MMHTRVMGEGRAARLMNATAPMPQPGACSPLTAAKPIRSCWQALLWGLDDDMDAEATAVLLEERGVMRVACLADGTAWALVDPALLQRLQARICPHDGVSCGWRDDSKSCVVAMAVSWTQWTSTICSDAPSQVRTLTVQRCSSTRCIHEWLLLGLQ